MDAGRELDALIAEKVMQQRKDENWFTLSDGRDVSIDGIPHYSTDIAAAKEVQAMIAAKSAVVIHVWGKQLILVETYFPEDHKSQAASEAHALCLAALFVFQTKTT